MPIVDGKYVSPTWVNGGPPALEANELNAMTGTIESNQNRVVALESTKEQVGDIFMTTRTDLGDKYLLCNGDTVDQAQYPELYDKLLPRGITNRFTSFKSSGMSVNSSEIQYINGYYMHMYITGSTASVYYTNDKSIWNNISVDLGSQYSVFRARGFSRIEYVDGKYYFIADVRVSNLFKLLIFSFDGPTPTGTIGYSEIHSTGQTDYTSVSSIYYLNGKLVFAFSTSSNILSLFIQSGGSGSSVRFSAGGAISGFSGSIDRIVFDGQNYIIGTSTYAYIVNASSSVMTQGRYLKCDTGGFVFNNGIFYSTSVDTNNITTTYSDGASYGALEKSAHIASTGSAFGTAFIDGVLLCPTNGRGVNPQNSMTLILFNKEKPSIEYIDCPAFGPYTTSIVISQTNDRIIIYSSSLIYESIVTEKVLPVIDGNGMFPMIRAKP